MNCQNCGAYNHSGRFCNYCRTQLHDYTPPRAIAVQNPVVRQKNNTWIIIVAVVSIPVIALSLMLGAVGIMFVNGVFAENDLPIITERQLMDGDLNIRFEQGTTSTTVIIVPAHDIRNLVFAFESRRSGGSVIFRQVERINFARRGQEYRFVYNNIAEVGLLASTIHVVDIYGTISLI